MATTVSKTFTTGEIGASGSVNIRSTKVTNDETTYWWSYVTAVNYNGSNTGSFDISAIPAGSVITAAKITWDAPTKNAVCSNFSSTSQVLDANNNALNNANVLAYLQGLSSFNTFTVKCRVNTTAGAYKQTSTKPSWAGSGDDSTTTNTTYARWTNWKLTVTYTPPDDDGTVSFGNNGTWQKCKIYYAVNGVWQKVKGFFGADGTWKQVK